MRLDSSLKAKEDPLTGPPLLIFARSSTGLKSRTPSPQDIEKIHLQLFKLHAQQVVHLLPMAHNSLHKQLCIGQVLGTR
jgi:hypothetical protein